MTTVRRQIVGLTIGTVVLTVVLLAAPIMIGAAIGIFARANTTADADAMRLVEVVESRMARGEMVDAGTMTPELRPGEVATFTFPDGTSFTAGTGNDRVTIDGSGEASGVKVSLAEPLHSIVNPIRIVGNFALFSIISAVVAILIARRQAGRLSAPLRELAAAARRLGSGDARPVRQRYRVEELDEVAVCLDTSAERIVGLLESERRFVGDASHQLRTPLTALSLRLDEIAETDDVAEARTEAQAAQEQVERLARVVDDLLAASRGRREDLGPVDVQRVLQQQRAEWSPVFAAADRVLDVANPEGLMVMGSAGALAQVIATLIENALLHGAGQVTVSVRDGDAQVVVEVSDQGAGIPKDLVNRIFERSVSGSDRTGIGLPVARALTEHLGGRLELVSASNPVAFGVFLTRVTQSSDQVDGAESWVGPNATAGTSATAGNTHRR